MLRQFEMIKLKNTSWLIFIFGGVQIHCAWIMFDLALITPFKIYGDEFGRIEHGTIYYQSLI